MGSDDLFKKRKAQKASALERLHIDRVKGPRFLIVCEGQKTEPYYFAELCEYHHLHTPRVRITPGNQGSSPDRIVACAVELFDEDAQLSNDHYDKIFCVIDRDKHDTYDSALAQIEKLKAEGKPFEAITSIPCFEYWLLLHFVYNRQSFHAAGKKSICEGVIRELRKHPEFNGYGKGQKGIYSLLRDKTATAVKHAQKAEKDVEQTQADNPSTRIHHLVAELQKLAESHGRKR